MFKKIHIRFGSKKYHKHIIRTSDSFRIKPKIKIAGYYADRQKQRGE